MGEIKSAFEKAMEKAAQIEKATPEELKRMEYRPKGNALAAQFLKEDNFDLEGELNKLKSNRKDVVDGIQEIFLRNILLPKSPIIKRSSGRAMQGIQLIKQNKKALTPIFATLNQLFNYYEQARQQALAQLKQAFEARLAQATRQLEQQMLGQKIKIDVERQPEFQQEWLRMQADLDSQYEKVLDEQKKKIEELG